MTRFVVTVALLLSSCGKSPAKEPPTPSGPVPTCAEAAKHLADVARQAGTSADMVARLEPALAESCERERWSDDARRCMGTAADEAAARECRRLVDGNVPPPPRPVTVEKK
jgi:hypothetical protein